MRIQGMLGAPASLLALTVPAMAADRAAIVDTYADIAQAGYEDSLVLARDLQLAIDTLIAAPSQDTLDAARAAWRKARDPYMQTEVFRFGNPVVDDWEGKVNAWPLDEGLIDYVDASYFGAEENAQAQLNVIANPTFTLSGETVDATTITPALLSDVLQEAGENEANVATGYHAIEFLLWGQDLVSDAPGAGNRPWTDYAQGAGCTGGNCDRRAEYLKVATDLLVSDLAWMTAQWAEGGAARTAVSASADAGIAAILTGMGNLSYGEMAGQRVKLGLILNDPEEEHDCFSDNTPQSHYFDLKGVENVYLGRYTRTDGTEISGPSLKDALAEADGALAQTLADEIGQSLAAADALRTLASEGKSYDMLLQVGNAEGETAINAVVDALVTQSRSIERASTALGLAGVVVEGDETLEGTGEVFQ
ncbi:MAG: peptidase [Rhodobacteraceae bacterium]|uniref:imelysin family protein n=3 Tax=Albidovulum sp. TaxID=1872424 RepID=UPI001E074944|nr:peptidase [Paracoccaceae bacterium]MCP5353606.1 peptidase [Paracoccaceae bacterium]HPE26419.1 imelysin family protein [Albidovulum sp.]HRV61889.1 imelysin family protein [Albidovulum sp.]